MAAQTDIQWADSTCNPWIGCTGISPACDHCYAEVSTPSRTMKVEWGTGKPRHRTAPATRNLPLRWNEKEFWECPSCGWRGEENRFSSMNMHPKQGLNCHQCRTTCDPARRRIFSLSLGDWLDNEVPAEWLADHLDVIRRTPNCDWLLLTKRIGNWNRQLDQALEFARAAGNVALYDWINAWLYKRQAPANVWLGITVVTQKEADRDILKMMAIPAVIRFLSIEPMVEHIEIRNGKSNRWSVPTQTDSHGHGIEWTDPGESFIPVDWVITGGESGSKARAPHPAWFHTLRDQCQAAGVAYLHKQNGEYSDGLIIDPTQFKNRDQLKAACQPDIWIRRDGVTAKTTAECDALGGAFCGMYKVGKLAAGRQIDGREYTAFPKAIA